MQILKKKTYKWSHLSVIIMHCVMALLVLVFTYTKAPIGNYIIGALLLIISLLALVPILKTKTPVVILNHQSDLQEIQNTNLNVQ
jgi:hypothetical protein